MKFPKSQWLLFSSVYSALADPGCKQSLGAANNFQEECASVVSKIAIQNATVYFSEFVPGSTNLSLPENNATCPDRYQVVSSDTCRIALYVATSDHSGIQMETWLPSNWTGRFLSVGNGGLNGCIDYGALAYGASLGFAVTGTNNGHNGTSGGAFYNNPETVADFAYRSIHTGSVTGKEVTKTLYGNAHTKSYYLGCSTGGRQGFKSAQDFPDDFDGIVTGAPALAFNNLTSWSGHFYTLTGPQNSSTFVPNSMWPIIHEDILKQCDMLDGYSDGILEDPLLCNYTSKDLICNGDNSTNCLTPTQAETVQQIYSPLYGADGSLVYPRMNPGSEITASFVIYNGRPFPYTTDWFRYAIYNDPSWQVETLNTSDYANAARINPSNIQTWNGDLSGVKERGAKVLHWHGLMDGIISSDNSPRYYEHVKQTMGLTPTELDSFYRFFQISGTGHCGGGDGAHAIGQSAEELNSLDPHENVLMAVVNWVENGLAPDTIVGTRWVNDTQGQGIEYQRAHCRYPKRNYYAGNGDPKAIESWECI